MARVPAPDYTGRDFDSAIVRLQRLVQSLHPYWTDFNVANYGNTLLRCMAFITDTLSWHTDFWAIESLPMHARLRRSMLAHTRWVGYEMQGRTAATTTVTVATASGNPHTVDIPIPSGTQFRAPGSVGFLDFQNTSAQTLTTASSSVSFTVEHSENAQDIQTSTGKANQLYKLSQSPYIAGSSVITADNGTYVKVSNFLLSEPTDLHFTEEVDDEERVIIRFGDGKTGAIPVGQTVFDYKVGGGLVGNVDAGAIKEIIDEIVDVNGDPVNLTVTNASIASGGLDQESIETAREQAPSSIRVPTNSVANEDFEIGARTIAGVADCIFLTSDDTVQIREGEGIGWIVAEGTPYDSGYVPPDIPSAAQILAVEDYWRQTRSHMGGFLPRAVGTDGSFFVDIDVVVSVHLDDTADTSLVPPSSVITVIGQAIYDRLADFFSVKDNTDRILSNVRFGAHYKRSDGTPISELPWSDVFNVIRDTTGVRKITPTGMTLNGVASSVVLKMWQFPRLRNVSVLNGEDGSLLYI